MQDLWQARLHARALAGGENDDVETRRFGHVTPDLCRSISAKTSRERIPK